MSEKLKNYRTGIKSRLRVNIKRKKARLNEGLIKWFTNKK